MGRPDLKKRINSIYNPVVRPIPCVQLTQIRAVVSPNEPPFTPARIYDMSQKAFQIEVLAGALAIVRLDPSHAFPEWVLRSSFYSVTRSGNELSVVCDEQDVPEGLVSDRGWRCLKIQGPLDLNAVGVLYSITDVLARAGVCVFALSSHDTDHLLVRKADLPRAVEVLSRAGHTINASR